MSKTLHLSQLWTNSCEERTLNCIFCDKRIELCQIEGLKTCKNPICYSCLENYWKLEIYSKSIILYVIRVIYHLGETVNR